MLEILKSGLVESDVQLMELAERYGHVIMSNENLHLDLSHWWLLREDGAEMLYVGTRETFAVYMKEREGWSDLPN